MSLFPRVGCFKACFHANLETSNRILLVVVVFNVQIYVYRETPSGVFYRPNINDNNNAKLKRGCFPSNFSESAQVHIYLFVILSRVVFNAKKAKCTLVHLLSSLLNCNSVYLLLGSEFSPGNK